MAVPTRTMVAPSSMATSKSALIPMDSSLSPWRSASPRSWRNHPRASSARSTAGGMAISPCSRMWSSPASASRAAATSPGAKPLLLDSPPTLTSSSASTTRPRTARAPVALAGQLQTIDGLDDVEERESIPDLVGLQVADEMPGHRAPERRHLVLRLLHAVFAERTDAGRHRLPNPLHVHRLGDGDEEHVLRSPPCPLSGARDPLAYLLEIAPDVVVHHCREF